MNKYDLINFIKESNAIERLHHEPAAQEIEAYQEFLALDQISIGDVSRLVSVIQPGAMLRSRKGMNVRIGDYYPLGGGKALLLDFKKLLSKRVNIIKLGVSSKEEIWNILAVMKHYILTQMETGVLGEQFGSGAC